MVLMCIISFKAEDLQLPKILKAILYLFAFVPALFTGYHGKGWLVIQTNKNVHLTNNKGSFNYKSMLALKILDILTHDKKSW